MSGEVAPGSAEQGPDQRPAEAGELCTCGRQAQLVYLGGRFGDTGSCGFHDGELPRSGVCTFCGDTIDHDYYAHAERTAGRDAPGHGDAEPQGGRCPLYRLRLADPLPTVHPGSVRVFDPIADRRERADGRLRRELLEVLLAAGADYPGTYTLLPDEQDTPDQQDTPDKQDAPDKQGAPPDEPGGPGGPGGPGESGTLDDVVFDISWCVRQTLSRDPHDVTGHHPDAGRDAVAVLVLLLGERLDELGVDPNPLTGLHAAGLIDRAGGQVAWSETVAHDRPLLIVRRVARRALDPEAPHGIYQTWSP